MTDAEKEDEIELQGYDKENERVQGVLESIKDDPEAVEELFSAMEEVKEKFEDLLEQRKKLDESKEKGECSEEEYNAQLERILVSGYETEIAERQTEVRLLTNELVKKRKMFGMKTYPNDPCPCGSGRKYKKCCGKGK